MEYNHFFVELKSIHKKSWYGYMQLEEENDRIIRFLGGLIFFMSQRMSSFRRLKPQARLRWVTLDLQCPLQLLAILGEYRQDRKNKGPVSAQHQPKFCSPSPVMVTLQRMGIQKKILLPWHFICWYIQVSAHVALVEYLVNIGKYTCCVG